MANTETSVSNLKINRLTQTQLENASSLSNTEAYWVDPEFTGGKVLATDSNGDIVESTVAPADIGTVKSVNNTSPDSNGNVLLTIPTVNDATLTINQGGALKGTFTANASSNVTVNLDGNQRNIGEIVQSIIPLTDSGLHILDGGIINGSGIYADFVTYIAGISSSYPDLFTTEANWQTALSTYGVCGKFVYDSVNNTVRLPKYNSKIYTGGGNAPVKGNGTTLGFTDGTNNAGMQLYNTVQNDFIQLATSVYNTPVGTTKGTALYSGKSVGITTDGTKSGIIADLANITTSLDGYYYIVVATSTKTDIQVDIDEIATDLNGKADVDLTNVNNTGTSTGAGWGMPSATYDDLTLGASGTEYTAPANGWFIINKTSSGSGQYCILENRGTNSSYLYGVQSWSVNSGNTQLVLPVKKNDVIVVAYNYGGTTSFFRFVYAVGSESEAS